MSKRGILKLGGFVGTVGAGAMLVAAAAGGTGAWFTDGQDGSLTAATGHLRLSTTDRTLSFTGLMPGEDRDKTIDYSVDASSGTSDIWLTFDTNTVGYAKFTGEKGNPLVAGGGLGRYGHFAVTNDGTPLFNSYNLANASAGVSGCADTDGHGFGAPSTSVADTPPNCGVPGAIKVASGVANGQVGHLKITFGFTGRSTGQDVTEVDGLPFHVVATQSGHKPGDANF